MNAVATPVDEVPVMGTLMATDRCDHCPAQAYVRVRLPSGAVLDFCAHDYDAQELGLIGAGSVIVIDDRGDLMVKPALV